MPDLRGLFAISLLVIALPLQADDKGDKQACADAYAGAQSNRKSGALQKAHKQLLLCASDRCPAIVQPDCVRWLGEVEAAIPSVVFAAKGADGKDVSDVRVSIDGIVVSETLDGKAVSLDPGAHKIRFERAGEPPVVQDVVVREGEKSRVVAASWARETKAPAPVATLPEPAPEARIAPWIFTGIGVIGLGTFGTFAALGWSKRSDLKSTCYAHCDQSEVDSAKRQLLVADIALGVSIVSLGVATYLFLDGPKDKTKSDTSVALDVRPLSGGGAAFFSGRF